MNTPKEITTMHKRNVINCGISGIGIDAADVVRGRRGNARVLTLRHAWPESVDGRVWDAISRSVRAHAQTIADRIGASVEVYSHAGALVWTATPTTR